MRTTALFVLIAALLAGLAPESARAQSDIGCTVAMSDLAGRIRASVALGGYGALDELRVTDSCNDSRDIWEVHSYRFIKSRGDFEIRLTRAHSIVLPLTAARLLESIGLGRYDPLIVSLEPSSRKKSLHEFRVAPEQVGQSRYLGLVAAPLDIAMKLDAVDWLNGTLRARPLTRTGALEARAFFLPRRIRLPYVENADGFVVLIDVSAELVPGDELLTPSPRRNEFSHALKEYCDEFNLKAARGGLPPALSALVEELVRQYKKINALGRMFATERAQWLDRSSWMSLAQRVPRVASPPPVHSHQVRAVQFPTHYSPVVFQVQGGVIFTLGDPAVFLQARDGGAAFALDGSHHLQTPATWDESIASADSLIVGRSVHGTGTGLGRSESLGAHVPITSSALGRSLFGGVGPAPWQFWASTIAGRSTTGAPTLLLGITGSSQRSGWQPTTPGTWTVPFTSRGLPPQAPPTRICVGGRCF